MLVRMMVAFQVVVILCGTHTPRTGGASTSKNNNPATLCRACLNPLRTVDGTAPSVAAVSPINAR